jgi:putative transposase
MNLVQQIHIKPGHSLWSECDRLCHLSKNLYNSALYWQRAYYDLLGRYLPNKLLIKVLALLDQKDFRALPAKVAQMTLNKLDDNYQSYFKGFHAFQQNPQKFKGVPRPPQFKPIEKGRFAVIYTYQAISVRALQKGVIQLSQTSIQIPTLHRQVKEVRIIPLSTRCHNIEIVYEQPIALPIANFKLAGIDIGLNNLATVVSNQPIAPVILNGRPLKSMNQFYNKKIAELKRNLPHYPNKNLEKPSKQCSSSKKIRQLTQKRNHKVKDYLHKASRKVVEHLQQAQISKVVIGQNLQWKQEMNLGSKNNQNFVAIPHESFIKMIVYKCKLTGIEVVCREESYTSKCSFLDNEPIQKHSEYQGKRIKRGLFVAQNGHSLNADVNGAANILKKEVPNAFATGIEGVIVRPVKGVPEKQLRKRLNKIGALG